MATQGRKLVEMGYLDLARAVSDYDKVYLDIGAGSGKFIYHLAKDHPEDYFIGLETSQDNLLDYARRIEKKTSRGGLPNVKYIVGSIESPPKELKGIADIVFINYPWTKFLKALVTGEASTLKKISSLFMDRGVLSMTLCYDRRYEPRFVDEYSLPDLSEEFIRGQMSRSYSEQDFELESLEAINSDEMKKELSEWGKKLAFSRDRMAWKVRFHKVS